MIEIKPEIKKALLKIDFFRRYEHLSKNFDEIKTPRKERLRYFDGQIIMVTTRLADIMTRERRKSILTHDF